MTLVEPLEALLEHRDYYTAHDLTRIPKKKPALQDRPAKRRQTSPRRLHSSKLCRNTHKRSQRIRVDSNRASPPKHRPTNARQKHTNQNSDPARTAPAQRRTAKTSKPRSQIHQLNSRRPSNKREKSMPSLTAPQRRNRLPRTPNRNPRMTRMVRRPIQPPLEQSKANINQKEPNSYNELNKLRGA